MGILKKIAKLFSNSAPAGYEYRFEVRCKRCGEVIPVRVNLSNDLSVEYGEKATDVTYRCRKIVMGEKRCYQQIELIMKFDSRRQLIDRRIVGGTFTDEE